MLDQIVDALLTPPFTQAEVAVAEAGYRRLVVEVEVAECHTVNVDAVVAMAGHHLHNRRPYYRSRPTVAVQHDSAATEAGSLLVVAVVEQHCSHLHSYHHVPKEQGSKAVDDFGATAPPHRWDRAATA